MKCTNDALDHPLQEPAMAEIVVRGDQTLSQEGDNQIVLSTDSDEHLGQIWYEIIGARA